MRDGKRMIRRFVMDQTISSCPNLTEIIIDKNVQVSSATSFLGAENDYVKTKAIGRMSDSFKKNAMSKLLIGNRYIAAADVKASINLVGDEAC